jgi:hypothetical protein
MRADLNIIDHDRLKINLPFYTRDLPAGAPRWMQTVTGIKRTMVSGVTTFIDGEHTGNLPGRLVRNRHQWAGGVRGTCNLDAEYDDPVRQQILIDLAAAADGGGIGAPAQRQASMDAALQQTMDEGATGPTHMSRMAREMEKEAERLKSNKPKI